MATVPNVPTNRKPIAFYGWLDEVHGLALCDHLGRVYFIDDATQTWQTLTDADAPRLVLAGRVDLAEAQRG